MTTKQFSQRDVLASVQRNLAKGSEQEQGGIEEEVSSALDFLRAIGRPIQPSATILDLGCGIGDTVRLLREMGHEASGVDMLEFWGRDIDQYWNYRAAPAGAYLDHLHVIDAKDYRLPFPDCHFDFVMSNQVFEHVFNYEEVFREVARVLKPGAISVHRFPGPTYLMEGHINVPFSPLCRFRSYLAAWALIGRRSPRQVGLGWRQTLAANVEMMKMANYPTKRYLRSRAEIAGVRIEFEDVRDLALRKTGRVARLTKGLPGVIRTGVLKGLSLISQRYMIIHAMS